MEEDKLGDTCCETKSAYSYRTSVLEEAAKSAKYHAEQSHKANQVMQFFSEHPEFGEFIRLVRMGAIQF